MKLIHRTTHQQTKEEQAQQMELKQKYCLGTVDNNNVVGFKTEFTSAQPSLVYPDTVTATLNCSDHVWIPCLIGGYISKHTPI